MQQPKDLRNIEKRAKKYWLKQPVIEMVKWEQTIKEQKLENRNGNKNNCRDISSDKLKKVRMKWRREDYKRET